MADHPCTTAAQFITALGAAVAGDTITLTAGNTFDTTSGFALRDHGGTTPITIQSSSVASLKAGQRVCPGHLPVMPLIRGTSVNDVILGNYGAGYWTLIGLAITTTNDQQDGALVRLPVPTSNYSPTSEDELPHHIIIDRCLVYGKQGALSLRTTRGFAFNCLDSQIINCYIYDFRRDGGDSQGIHMKTAKRILIQNNYIEAAGENVFIGGEGFGIEDYMTTDIIFRGNHLSKPNTWNPWHPDFGTVAGSCTEAAGPGTVTCTGTSGTTTLAHGMGVSSAYQVKLPNGEHRHVLTTPTTTTFTLASAFTSDPVASAWTRQKGWTVKNLYELKYGDRVLAEGNFMERNWPPGQGGQSVLFNNRNDSDRCPWIYTRNQIFRENWVKNATACVTYVDLDPVDFGKSNRTVRIAGDGTITTSGTAATFSDPQTLAVGDVIRITSGFGVAPFGVGRCVTVVTDATHVTLNAAYSPNVTDADWENWPVSSTVISSDLTVVNNVWENIGVGENGYYAAVANVPVGNFYAPQTTGLSTPGGSYFDAVHGQHGPNNITFLHNTMSASDSTVAVAFHFGGLTDVSDNNTFKDNIIAFGGNGNFLGPFGADSDSGGNANTTIANHTDDSVYTSNVFYGTGANATNKPAGNFWVPVTADVGWDSVADGRFELTSGTYRAGQANQASDGTDMGANVRVVRARVFGRHSLGQGW